MWLSVDEANVSVASLQPVSPAGARVAQLTERSQSLTNFLWSKKRAVEDFTLRQKAVSLEKELWEKEMEKIGGGGHRNKINYNQI